MVKLTEARRKKIDRMIQSRGLDPQTVDVIAEWDNSLSIDEIFRHFESLLDRLCGSRKEKSMTDIQEEQRQAREFNHARMREDETKLLEEWKSQSVRLEDLPIYRMFDRYLDMQKKGYSFGTVICGETGLSKTFRAVGILDGEHMAYLNTYTTPLALYMWLYENKDKDCIIDDVEGIWRDKQSLSYIKGFCGEVKGTRLVQYHSTKSAEGVPSCFQATGTMTLIYNEIPSNVHVDAVLSRLNYVDMNLSFAERVATINKIAQEPYKDLTVEERIMIVKYIESVANPTIRNLNFRTLFRIFECFRYDKVAWKEMADDILKADEELSIIHEAMSRGLSTAEVCRIYQGETGNSRRQFFYKKKELVKRMSSANVQRKM